MAEDQSAEKTEEPTPKQREKFREEGNIATSPDVGGAAILATSLLVVAFGGGAIYRGIEGSFTDSFELAGRVREFGLLDLYAQVIHSSGMAYIRAIALLVAACGLAGLTAGVAQTGLNFSLKPMEFKAEKFNPISNLKSKIFSIWAVAQVGLSLLKAAVIAVALYFVIRSSMPMMLTLPGLELEASLGLLGAVFLKLFIVGVLAASALAVADYALNRMRIHKQMMMTKQQVKEDFFGKHQKKLE
ncbi:MAG: EscU/YscU/HrcU family type III secretion system export apparatus switch protein, partial [Nannocystaceae bacterium]